MIWKNFLIFDGKSTVDFDCDLYGFATLNAPGRDTVGESIVGKNGEIIIDNARLENITITYTGVIRDEDMTTSLRALRGYMLSRVGYCRLEDSFNPNEFRMARFEGGFEINHDRFMNKCAFDMAFNCRPERWLVDGENDIALSSTATTLLNPTYFDAKPFFTVTGNGRIIVSNDEATYTMVLAGTSGQYFIDCENMDCYSVNTSGEYVNLNSKIVLSDTMGDYPHFPVLAGDKESTITATGFTSVSMKARWWTV